MLIRVCPARISCTTRPRVFILGQPPDNSICRIRTHSEVAEILGLELVVEVEGPDFVEEGMVGIVVLTRVLEVVVINLIADLAHEIEKLVVINFRPICVIRLIGLDDPCGKEVVRNVFLGPRPDHIRCVIYVVAFLTDDRQESSSSE